jgi:hypothetical protein
MQKMKTVGRTIIASAALISLTIVQAEALAVRSAVLTAGLVTVTGGQAARTATILWEGVAVTTAAKGGSFSFTTTIIPADCVGTLSDGVEVIDVRVQGCAVPQTGLPGTGQTISYAPGDDGDLEVGGPLDYVDNGDGTVTDRKTGLTWEKKTDLNVNEVYSWPGAFEYVASLNAMNGGQGFAGHNDWRLPNVRELLSIFDYSRQKPILHPIFGPTMGTLNFVDFWSSTSWVDEYYDPAYNAWGVDFAKGTVLAFGKASSLRVRAVRGGR